MQDTGGFFVAVLKKAAKASTATDQNLDAAVEATDVVAPEIETKSAKIDQADRVQVDEASTESAKPVIVTDGCVSFPKLCAMD